MCQFLGAMFTKIQVYIYYFYYKGIHLAEFKTKFTLKLLEAYKSSMRSPHIKN